MELLMQMSDRCAELSVALKNILDVPLGCDDNLCTVILVYKERSCVLSRDEGQGVAVVFQSLHMFYV